MGTSFVVWRKCFCSCGWTNYHGRSRPRCVADWCTIFFKKQPRICHKACRWLLHIYRPTADSLKPVRSRVFTCSAMRMIFPRRGTLKETPRKNTPNAGKRDVEQKMHDVVLNDINNWILLIIFRAICFTFHCWTILDTVAFLRTNEDLMLIYTVYVNVLMLLNTPFGHGVVCSYYFKNLLHLLTYNFFLFLNEPAFSPGDIMRQIGCFENKSLLS